MDSRTPTCCCIPSTGLWSFKRRCTTNSEAYSFLIYSKTYCQFSCIFCPYLNPKWLITLLLIVSLFVCNNVLSLICSFVITLFWLKAFSNKASWKIRYKNILFLKNQQINNIYSKKSWIFEKSIEMRIQ